MTKHKFDEFYDLAGGQSGTAKVAFLANQLIHSFIFAAVATDGGSALAEGIFVNSVELEFPRFRGQLRACGLQSRSGVPFVVDG